MSKVKQPKPPTHRGPKIGRPNYQAPALDKGLEILEFLAHYRAPHGLAEMAAALDRSKNELYRMVLALERRGYIARTTDDRFFLTNQLFQLGMQTPPIHNLHDAALPVMHGLAKRLEQSCHLVVRNDDNVVVVARVESSGPLGFAVRVGYRRHVTDSASGTVLFGLSSGASREIWLKSLKRTAPRGTDFDRFLHLSDSVRAKGYFKVPSTSVSAIVDISTPIYDGVEPGPIAALTMPFLTRREEPADIPEAAKALVDAARLISEKMKNG
jgi:DNA-binding IclR family transcriptional regulator